jgi:hypothetical protein
VVPWHNKEHMEPGDPILSSLLTRLHRTEPVKARLVLVEDRGILGGAQGRIDSAGKYWTVARVTGEVTLRAAMLAAPDGLVAILPLAARLPRDILESAYQRRTIRVRAEDIVSAALRRDCDPIVDEELAEAVFDLAADLLALAKQAPSTIKVRVSEVRALVLRVQLGADLELAGRTASSWLTAWIATSGRLPKQPKLLRDALKAAYGQDGVAMAWAVEHGVGALLTVAALSGSAKGKAQIPKLPAPPDTDSAALRALVESAVRTAWPTAAAEAKAYLQPAENLANRVRWQWADVSAHPLLLTVLDVALHDAFRDIDQGRPPTDSELAPLRTHLYAADRAGPIALVRATARVRRGLDILQPPAATAPWSAWFGHAQPVARLDLALRQLRLAALDAGGGFAQVANSVIANTLAARDGWNAGFAATLAREWPAATGANDARGPIALHHVGAVLVRPLLEAGQRVYLVVLDGCDLASALDMVDSLADDNIGIVRLEGSADTLGEAIRQRPSVGVGVSLVPTITSHARRALMGGVVPGAATFNLAEDAQQNASSDKLALDQHASLGPFPKKLFLKGDLHNEASALHAVLSEPGHTRLAVAVWNGVDDWLSSHGTTPHGPWKFSELAPGALQSLKDAISSGWTVLVTADHGHTPFVAADRKIGTTNVGARFDKVAHEATVAFEHGPLPQPPIHALHRVGAFFGQQRAGYHGGASFEEVVVPLFALGNFDATAAPVLPDWWWGGSQQASPAVQPILAPAAAPQTSAPPVPQSSLAVEPPGAVSAPNWRTVVVAARERGALDHLSEREQLTTLQLARLMGVPPFLVQGMMAQLLHHLTDALGEAPFEIVDRDGEVSYLWNRHRAS